MKYKIVCTLCGSDDVKRDAWASWDKDKQEWVLDDIFDSCFCENCNSTSDTLLKRVTIKTGETI
ncbi:hypothetical protein [Rhizobium phage RHph_X2_28B]|uniref:hypothetical protein n=1 Tax=Rhizobium phage RHph_X2_28B TaxID=2836086 RepID=UPI0023292674|nr:hypothetical protein PP751_gp037 [Rhizobium phage RHph_X2_28B]QWY83489.1 hypothetical protein [Rhizobium phage RHph_X2_28B]QWY83725.1 hypothetical protein [Rhizobium phage RHph_X3_15]